MSGGNQRRDWVALLEALGVFLLIMIYIWWLLLSHPGVWIVLLGVVIGTHVVRGEGPGRLGFGWASFRAAFAAVFPFALALCLTLLAMGALLGTLRPTTARAAAVSIVWYILWGMFQQYLLNAYFVNRLAAFSGKPGGNFVPLFAALLFSLAHLPNWFLMAVTLAGGFVCARVYLRYRNLYVLALAHGMVGFCLFLAVPDSLSAHFLVGPRYLLDVYGIYPELLL